MLWYLFGVIAVVSGTDPKYPVNEIPDELIYASRAVIRKNEQVMTIQDNGEILFEKTYALTILDVSGEEMATFFGHYDKYTRLRSLTGRIFNQKGEQEELLRGEDILDVSAIRSYSLYEDSRVKIIDPEFHEYPYTVEYKSVYVLKSFLDMPDWRVYPYYNVSVENSSFEIRAPVKNAFRYEVKNMELEPEITHSNKGIHYRWEVNQLSALVKESLTRDIKDLSPVLYIGPNAFNYGGRPGNMSTWKDFGKWIWQLGSDKQELTQEEIEHVKELVKEVPVHRDKVSVVYKYMQDKVRYVNITLGIGGFEPIPASQVSELGYGDCKALTNYMKSLLSAAGISSLYTLVSAGDQHPQLMHDFSSQQFNHVILSVPDETDTIWLECTNQRLPAGYLGSFTDDRGVLLIDEEGGELSRTPGFSNLENRKVMNVSCTIDAECNATVELSRLHGGVFFGKKQSYMYQLDDIEQKRVIQKNLKLSGFIIEDFNHKVAQGNAPTIIESIRLTDDQFIPTEGEIISLQLGIFSEDLEFPTRSRNRKYPVYIKRGYTYMDSVIYVLPEGFVVHQLPEPVALETPFGEYRMNVREIQNGLLYTRDLILYKGEYEPIQFSEFYRFFRRIRSSDQKKALLKKNL